MIVFLRFIYGQRVFLNLLFWGILAYGLIVAIPNLPVERYPNINFGEVAISTIYPGASSEEVERLVTEEIEDVLRGMENLEFVRSSSKSGFSNVNVKFIDDTDYEKLYDELRLRVLSVQNRFPVVNGKPLNPNFNVTNVDDWLPVIEVNLMSARAKEPLAKRSLTRLAEQLQLKLEAIEGVREVVLSGRETQQFTLALKPEALQRHGLSVFEIQTALVLGGGSLPVSSLNTAQGELKMKIDDRYRNIEDLINVVVRQDSQGSLLLLGELLDRTQCGFEKIQGGVVTTVNGRDVVSCKINKMASANAKSIKTKVLEQLEDFKKDHSTLPIELNTTLDSTLKIDAGLGVLQGSLTMSLVLVMLTLFLFLSPSKTSTTLWVCGISVAALLVMVRYNDNTTLQLWALAINTVVVFVTCRAAVLTVSGIIFTFIGCLLMFHLCGYSLNEITLLAFVLTSGILVDDAIVVLENIHCWKDKGASTIDAAIYGTAEVFWPIISASLTTIAAFMPMLLMTGATGEFFALIPITVSAALAISLFESLAIMPIHFVDIEHFDRRKAGAQHVENSAKTQGFSLIHIMERSYDASLRVCRAHPVRSLMCVFILFMISIAMIVQSVMGPSSGYSPLLKLKFFPDDTANLQIEVRRPSNSTLDATDQLCRQIADDLIQKGPGFIRSVTANAGITLDSAYKPIFGSHVGFMLVELPDRSNREFSNPNAFIDSLRQELELRYEKDGVAIEVTGQKDGPPVGAPLHVRCSGVIDENVVRLGQDLHQFLTLGDHAEGPFWGIIDLKTDRESLSPILVFKTQSEAAARQGLSTAEVRQYVATLFDGAYVGDFRLEDEDIPLRMKLSRPVDGQVEDMLQLPIVQRNNHNVYYRDVGRFSLEESPASLERRNYQRVVNLTANIRENSLLQARDFTASVEQWYATHRSKYPGTELSFGGEAESTGKSYSSLISAFVLSIFLIYAILAVQFRSYAQPMLIMSNIVFSCIGVVLMLGSVGVLMLFLPRDFIAPERSMITVQSFIAMVGLTGMVVNDAIVLIDFINQERQRGLSLENAVVSAAHSRLRPIFMTSWTTIAGLLPLAIGIPEFSVTWGPFATCFIAGLTVSTLITLFIVPIMYQMLESLKLSWSKPQMAQATKNMAIFLLLGLAVVDTGHTAEMESRTASNTVVVSALSANGQNFSEPLSNDISLDEALELCLKHQPRRWASQYRYQASKHQADSDRGAFRPQLSLSAQSGFKDDRRSAYNPLGEERFAGTHVQLEQYLYGFGLRSSVLELSEASIELRRIAMEETSSLLTLELRQAFMTALLRQEQWALAQANSQRTAVEWDIAQAAFRAGVFSETEQRQSRQNHLGAVMAEKQAKFEVQQAQLKLDQLTGCSARRPKGQLGEAMLEAVNSPKSSINLAPSDAELKASASARYLQTLWCLAQKKSASYRKSVYPQLKAIVSSDRSGEEFGDGQSDWRAGLQLSWSPDLQNSVRSLVSAEEEEALACAQDLENHLRARREQWQSLRQEREVLLEQIVLQKEILSESEKNYQAIFQSYKLGRVLVTKVEDARLVNTQARLNLAQLQWRWDINIFQQKRWME